MAFNGEMTVNEAKISMNEMWEKMEKDMSRIADIEIPSLTVQIMIAALCKDCICTVDVKSLDQMSLFYAKRNMEKAVAMKDEAKVAICEKEIGWLTMCINEAELRLIYNHTEMKKINAALGVAA